MRCTASLLLPVLAFLTACASRPAAGVVNPPALKPAATGGAPTNSAADPLLVTQNPDGTITVSKEPSKEDANNAKGLVVPAQVIVPITPTGAATTANSPK
jgi:hypothetical protein